MWPKVIAQLLEVLPHVSRLLPMADRFFQSKAAGEESSRRTVEAMEGLRGELGQVTVAHSGLSRQLNEQGEKLSTLGAEMRTFNATANALDSRLARTGRRLTLLFVLVGLTMLLGIASFVMLLVLFAHHS